MDNEFLTEEEKFYQGELKKLDKWFYVFEEYPRLTFEEAKDIYQQYLEVTDATKKRNLKQVLINGTVYHIYEYLKNNKYLFLSNGITDIDDIISTLTENWLREIDNGSLLKVNNFSSMLKLVVPKLYNKKYKDCFVCNYIKIPIPKLLEVLERFIKDKDINANYNLNDFTILMGEYGISRYYNKHKIFIVYEIFNKIYNTFRLDLKIEASWNAIVTFFNILVENSLDTLRVDESKIKCTGFEEQIVDRINNSEIVNFALNNSFLTPKQREVLMQLYCKNDSEEIKMGNSSIRWLENTGLRTLRNSETLKDKYYGGR